ncbi:uncharacterized protein LOC131611666 isoform X3 [Vicia villosa]|uniref:uncharacterized protein LOC131611666 isoform X3 n=2 Tax=Vicia villosa TaxID=3911 RepID=UPI00273C5964|nr:uncharacterized protein LOC131611666 isoform X3 [Vicia villosa]
MKQSMTEPSICCILSDVAQLDEQAYNVRLRVMVDSKSNKVLYVEAVPFGSLSSLYQSIADLDENYICKEMLLNPRNSMEAYCKKLKLNIDDTEPIQYFLCENSDCNRNQFSLFKNQKCSCGKVMNRELHLSPQPECLRLGNGFATENATFIISDGLYVMPNVFGSVVHLHHKHKITNFEAIVEQNVQITKKEVVDILKLSLSSKTPLTDFIFKKQHFPAKLRNRNQTEFKIGEVTHDKGRQMSVKVVRQKSTGKILFAEAGADFIDFVCSFQTFPLGGVLHMLQGVSSLECIDNLYKSVAKLSPDMYLVSQDVKEKLRKPLVAAQFELGNQILPISAASLPVHYYHSYFVKSCLFGSVTTSRKHGGYSRESFVPLKLVEPKFSAWGKFAKGPSMFMVTDDLVVTPISSFNAVSYLNSLNVPLLDVEERVVKIGLKEGLSVLKASLTSTSALTNGLSNVFKSRWWWRSLRLRSVVMIVLVSFAVVGHNAAVVEGKSFKLPQAIKLGSPFRYNTNSS